MFLVLYPYDTTYTTYVYIHETNANSSHNRDSHCIHQFFFRDSCFFTALDPGDVYPCPYDSYCMNGGTCMFFKLFGELVCQWVVQDVYFITIYVLVQFNTDMYASLNKENVSLVQSMCNIEFFSQMIAI